MVGRVRQRHPHYIAGLGDGNVRKPHQKTANDDFFPPEDKQMTPYIRSGRTQKALREAREMFHPETFSGSGDGIASPVNHHSDGPWQISAMALLCVMGLLVGLFLHLVTDSSEKQAYPRRSRARISPTKKKKTDEWSSDEQVDEDREEDAYIADSESLYYPYHPRYGEQQQHRIRRSNSNSGTTLHHRMPGSRQQQQQHSSTSTAAGTSPGPTLRPTRSIDSGTLLISSSRSTTRPVIEGVASTDEDTTTTLLSSPWKQQQSTTTPLLNARPLSPVSSFASTENHSQHLDIASFHSGDEELGTPPLVSHCGSFDVMAASHQNSSVLDVLQGSDHEHETPRAGTTARPSRAAIFVEKGGMSKSPLLPPPPEHEPLQQQDVARAKTPIMLPYIPHLEIDPTFSTDNTTDEEHHPYAIPPSPEHRVLRHSMSEPAEPVAYPGHVRQEHEQMIHRQLSQPDISNEARKNIIHKREDITHCTDAESSLMGSVEFSELFLESVIGGGGFGQVWKATWRSTPVAVKILTGSAQREIVSKGILEEFAAEINMLKGMRHPNICLYMGACLKPPNRAIITELASNGSLWDALRLPLSVPFAPCDGTTRTGWPLTLYSDCSHGGLPPAYAQPAFPPRGTWPWNLVKRVACGAARGMTYLHSGTPPVLHRDLKSANLLLDDSYTCKVCDFGLSRLKAQERSMTGNCGTVQWMAPEILSNQRYAEPADVYSFGIILWEMLTGECPYEGMSAIQCALAVLNRDDRPEIPTWCPPAFAALIRACWDKEPSRRPTFPQILLALDAMP